MAYWLSVLLKAQVGFTNVFGYHTVRAGGAAFTAFFLSILLGPMIIRRLRQLKIGQYIREDHVESLHELHKSKAGTPTMGGLMIIVSTLSALLLWGRLSNRLLWVAMLVLLVMGLLGFMDDYIKLKRKHNAGLSARAKFSGQILTGLLLGIYLVNNPITVSESYVQHRDVINWVALESTLAGATEKSTAPDVQKICSLLSDECHKVIKDNADDELITAEEQLSVLNELNAILTRVDLYEESLWHDLSNNTEARRLLQTPPAAMTESDLIRFNRLILEQSFEGMIATSIPNLHTKLGVPGFKDLFIPLGTLYILFVTLVMVSITNAVNLTDGLDGLAAGVSIISILAYAAIAYIISRADWSRYLFLTYVPEASELFVFGAALLGSGLGFLWFNGHPAEVFMGDTGSLALGGALGALALLTKQELLLPIVAGLFVLEAASVVIQVASYKLTGKRVFRMAPLHHHFELGGWLETKVTLRFWILAFLFAILSLGTLKLR
jgi:UDP-N-acetylmuramyl pentapeptide phosphotransferase/UDP-N-acetylglucosamine-1-phosphate transferase